MFSNFKKLNLILPLCVAIPLTLTGCSKNYKSETFAMTRFFIHDFIISHESINTRPLTISDTDPEDLMEFFCSNEVKTQNLVNGMIHKFFLDLINIDDPKCKVKIDLGKNQKWFRFTFLNDYFTNNDENSKICKGFRLRVDRYDDKFKLNLSGNWIINGGSLDINVLHNGFFDENDMVLHHIYDDHGGRQHWSFSGGNIGYDEYYWEDSNDPTNPENIFYSEFCPSNFFKYIYALSGMSLSICLLQREFPNIYMESSWPNTDDGFDPIDNNKEQRGYVFYWSSASSANIPSGSAGERNVSIPMQNLSTHQFLPISISDFFVSNEGISVSEQLPPDQFNSISFDNAEIGDVGGGLGFKAQMSWGELSPNKKFYLIFSIPDSFYGQNRLIVKALINTTS